jgi:hypothetical protein
VDNVEAGTAESVYSKENVVQQYPLKFDVNCSGLTNHALEVQCPGALAELTNFMQSSPIHKPEHTRPYCVYYQNFISGHGARSFWESVADGRTLRPGDMIVFCQDTTRVTKGMQHIMVVAQQPEFDQTGWAECKIYDSTGIPHGIDDTRLARDCDGVGTGRVGLRIDQAGKLLAFKWGAADGVPLAVEVVAARLKP